MPLAGNLHQFALPDILRVIESGQRTGVLVLSRGKLQAAIYFAGGQWLLGERVGSSLVLAQQLARVGLITPDQFESAVGLPYSEAGEIPDVQVVRTLIGARMLTQDDLRTFAVDDAVNLLAVVLAWPDGDFVFEDNAPPPQGRLTLPLPVGPLVSQALRYARMNSAPAREAGPPTPPQLMVNRDAVVDFADIDPESGVAVQLTRDQWRFLTAVDGRLPLWAVCQKLQAPEETILRLASELIASKVLVVVGRAAPVPQS